jgi:isopentenyl phosphate kinase
MGMAIVADAAAQLNRIVVHEFLEADIPAVSLLPSQCLVTNGRVADSYFTCVFEEYIKHGLLPVTGGDVLADRQQGCTIWSTEEVLSFFARQFEEQGWKVEQIVHVTESDGVYDADKKLLKEVTKINWPIVKEAITATKGFDVTGGMGLKLQESLQLGELGIESKIIGGIHTNNLYHALSGHEFVGTVVK